jgi:hypothetical protein
MSDIVSRPYTPEGEATWERLEAAGEFGNSKNFDTLNAKYKARFSIAGIPIRELTVEDLKK